MLRNVCPADLPIFFEQQLDPQANQMAAFTRRDPADREAFFDHWQRLLADPAVVARTILDAGEVIGYIARYQMMGKPEVTYWIGRQYWGRGFATRALGEFLSLVSECPLFAHTAHDNAPSARVLEKCGFERVGRARFHANARGAEIEEIVWRRDP